MTRRDQMMKWLVYGLALLPVWILDGAILSRYPLWGACPVLLPLAVAAVAVWEGPIPGGTYGLAVGFFWATAYGGAYGMRVTLLTLVGLGAGMAAQYVLSQNFLGHFICGLGALLLVEVWNLGLRLFFHVAGAQYLLQVAGAELVVSLIWMPLIHLYYWRVYKKVGGIKLA